MRSERIEIDTRLKICSLAIASNRIRSPRTWRPEILHLVSCVFLITMISLTVFTVSAEEGSKGVNVFAIKSIEIKGSKTMPAETILGILQTRVGEEVSLKLIKDDVKELYKLGQFSNIQVDSSGSREGIHLTFILEEWPKVKDISLNGNEELKDSKIKDVLTIGSGRSLSGKLLHENKSRIESLYRKKGYYLARVEADVIADPEYGKVSVSFKINEGKKIEVKEIDIIGNRRISDREIRKQMKTKKGKKFDDAYLEGDLETIVKYYQQNGFIYAKIIDSARDFNEDETGIIVRMEVEEGPQFRVGQIRAYIRPSEGDEPIFTEKEILKEFTLREGDIFSEMALMEGKFKIEGEMYPNRGRVSTRVMVSPDYNPEEEIVDLKITISEGGPAYIDGVSINWVSETNDEPHKTKEYVIRRELNRFDIKEGEMFSYQNIKDARRKILTLGPFIRNCIPRPQLSLEQNPEDDGQRVTVGFNIEESRQSGMFSIAGGYGSEDGIFGALDIWDDNILGRAWRLHLRGEIGVKGRRTGQINFSTPWIFNSPTFLGFSVYNKSTSTKYYYSEEEDKPYKRYESVGGSITVGRPITRQTDASVRLRNENVRYKEEFDDRWEVTSQGKIQSVNLIVDRDTRQFITSIFDPSSGSYNIFSAEYAGLSGYKFQKYTTESSLFIPTWWKLVLVLHLRTGYFNGENAQLLEYERFALGGIDSIRGYELYSIRPSGLYEIYGGNQMALLNVEYRFPITDVLRGLVFFDAGQTWGDDEWPWDNFKPRKSIGIGLRIDLLGALARIEYGYPLDAAREGEPIKGGKIEFDIGPAF